MSPSLSHHVSLIASILRLDKTTFNHVLAVSKATSDKGQVHPLQKKGLFLPQEDHRGGAGSPEEADQEISCHDSWSTEANGAGAGLSDGPQSPVCSSAAPKYAKQSGFSQASLDREIEEEKTCLLQLEQALDCCWVIDRHVLR
jgi:hypothetical protein